MRRSIYIFLFVSSLFFVSCRQKEKKDGSRIPYLEVDGRYLYMDELQSIVPNGSSKEDSTSLTNDFVKNWITQVLLYGHAENNISDPDEIETLVEDYRKSLIIHQYQQNLIKSRLGDGPSEEEMQAFYEENKEKFILTNNLVKGVYIKMPLGAPKISSVAKWFKDFNQKSLEKIEKYSIQNATSYEYFGENWVMFNEIAKNLPFKIEDPVHFIENYKFVETQDSSFHYFIRILDNRVIGSIEPYDVAKEKIKTILINKQKNNFIKTFENNLYNEAVKDKLIKYYKPEEQQ